MLLLIKKKQIRVYKSFSRSFENCANILTLLYKKQVSLLGGLCLAVGRPNLVGIHRKIRILYNTDNKVNNKYQLRNYWKKYLLWEFFVWAEWSLVWFLQRVESIVIDLLWTCRFAIHNRRVCRSSRGRNSSNFERIAESRIEKKWSKLAKCSYLKTMAWIELTFPLK